MFVTGGKSGKEFSVFLPLHKHELDMAHFWTLVEVGVVRWHADGQQDNSCLGGNIKPPPHLGLWKGGVAITNDRDMGRTR